MINRTFLPFLISLTGIFVLCPPYFAYSLIMLLALNIVYTITIYFSIYLNDFEKKYKNCLVLLGSVISTVIFHLFLGFISPIMGITLSFVIYLIPLTTYMFDNLITKNHSVEIERKKTSFKILVWLNINTLIFSILREFIAFSSISIPSSNGIIGINLPINIFEKISFIGGTIPGILILSATCIMIIHLCIAQKKDELNS